MLLERHANKASSTTQTQGSTWPTHAPKRQTAGQESAPMHRNNGKQYKRKHSHATALQTANTPPKSAKNTRDHSSYSLTTLNII